MELAPTQTAPRDDMAATKVSEQEKSHEDVGFMVHEPP